MKIIIDNRIPFVDVVFEPYMNVDYRNAADITNAAVQDADALIVRTRTICNAALLHESRVKFIASATIGCDHIDDTYCHANGIAWTNAAGCNAGAVMQYVAAAILETAQRSNMLLADKTIGIVGAGNVGRLVAQFAAKTGMRTLLCDPPRAEAEGATNDIIAANAANAFVPIEEIAANADIITFHTPLTYAGKHPTFHLADSNFFRQLSRNPIFINTSRGEVVDEPALRYAIAQGKVSAAILDVWENEPQIDEETLRLATIATPHIAGYSAEGKRNAAQMAVQAVARFFNLPLQTWQPPPLPLVATPTLPTNLSPQEKMYLLSRHFYDIMADDAALRSHPHSGEYLRSHYTLRRQPPIPLTHT
jgi:erythronate-4-phosphate dehydrogenase